MQPSSIFCGFTVPSFSGSTRGLSEKAIVSRNVMPASLANNSGSIARPDHREADRMAHMGLQSTLPESASILHDPLRIDKLLAQFQQCEGSGASCLNMVAKQ